MWEQEAPRVNAGTRGRGEKKTRARKAPLRGKQKGGGQVQGRGGESHPKKTAFRKTWGGLGGCKMRKRGKKKSAKRGEVQVQGK